MTASQVARRIINRRLKEMLLDTAEMSGVDPAEIAEWLEEAAGVRVAAARSGWRGVRRAILSAPVTPQELAAFLLEKGVEVNEREWIRIVEEGSLLQSSTGRRVRQGGKPPGKASGGRAEG